MLVISASFAAIGAFSAIAAWRVRVLLHPDEIESRGMFLTRRVRREDLHGWRLIGGRLRLVAQPGRGRDLSLPQDLELDAAIDGWLAEVPSLDAQEQQASLQAVLADAELLGSNSEKIEAIAAARRNGRRYHWV